jgi:large subunit ribosomal protein L9
MATVASDHNKMMVEKHKERLAKLEVQKVKTYRERAEAISKYSVTLEANANEDGHLYGSIVAVDIATALKSAGYEVEPGHIKLEGPLKELGMYTVKVELHAKAKAEVKVWVVPSAS